MPIQLRVREHLISLLNASGMRVGIPKSPSVIFSAASQFGDAPLTGTMARAHKSESMFSSANDVGGAGAGLDLELSTERASTPTPETGTMRTDYTSDSFPRVFRDFDFLEQVRYISYCYFNCN